jgi:NAD(P)-dependent dehydrogenase (short-subunit alcohol dehydrogenase family)
MSKKVEGKIAFVTGGATGMCLAAAKRSARKDTLDAVIADIGKNVTAVQGDVANLSDIDRSFDTVKSAIAAVGAANSNQLPEHGAAS